MKISSPSFSKGQFETCLNHLLPENSGLQLQSVELLEGELLLVVKATERERTCPVCGVGTTRVQSQYQRTVQDLPWIDLRVRLRLHVRRFFCTNTSCSRRIFSERLPDFVQAYARRTDRLRQALLEIGWADGEAKQAVASAASKPSQWRLPLYWGYFAAAARSSCPRHEC